MRQNVIHLEQFYASRLGGAARDMAGRRLANLWPELAGKDVLGYGYSWPYLAPYEAQAKRVVLAMPGGQGALAQTTRRGVCTCLTEDHHLPFADATPFGAGRPFSRTQRRAALRAAGFVPTVWSGALFVPPARPLARPALIKGFESFGETVWPTFSGLVLVEAIKRLYAETSGQTSRLVMRPRFGSAPIGKPAANREI